MNERPAYVLGIDPGLSGALAIFDLCTRDVEVFDMPVTDGKVDPAKLAAIVDMCKTRGPVVAAIELVSSMPRQKGSFNFGVSAGILQGVLGALGVPFSMVQPAQWKGATGLHRMSGETQADVKTRARFIATKLWPEHATDFKRIKDDGRAESSLIARHYASKMGWI
jgi:crossover junction endodeoxyribonuclease RuvC